MRKNNILHVITGLGVGGAENVVLEICRHNQKKLKNKMSVFAFGVKDDLVPVFEKDQIQVDFVRMSKNLKGLIKVISCLHNRVKDKNIDIIHAHMFHSLVLACLIRIRHPRVKVVFTPHNINLGSKFREILVFLSKPFRDVDIVFSSKQISLINKNDSVIIPNGINTNRYRLSISKFEVFTFLTIGRIEDAKNHLALIEIVRNISISIPYRIIIAGDGYLKEELQKAIDLNGLEQKIELLGIRSDIPQLCNKSHAFILPSLWEGMPIALLEAGAAGLPIVTTPVGSIPTIINSNNGFLADIENFAEAMQYVLENYNEAKVRGEKLGEEIRNKYDTSIMYAKHIAVYSRLLCRDEPQKN